MDWLKNKKSRASEKKKRLVQGRERGAMLLEDLIECCDGKSNPIKFYSADQINKATNNFSKSNHVFSHLFEHQWYSGKNENSDMIFIHKLIGDRYQGEHLTCRDIAISSMVSGHKNFLKLVGCCLDSKDPVMVYHGVKELYLLNLGEKPWKRRMKIAEDIATALAYLHTAFPRPFVYRNMSVENILLDEDFSLCVSIPEGFTFVDVDAIRGISIYIDTRYARHGVVSEKTDVFAIGIFMLILLTGEDRLHVMQKFLTGEEEETKDEGEGEYEDESEDCETMVENAPNWFSNSMEELRMEEIADPEMLEKMGEISEEELCRMKSFLILSQICIGVRGEVPTMVEVAKELKKSKDLFKT